jgi:hypothetical protein
LNKTKELEKDLALADDLDTMRVAISNCLRNLLDFRAHIAQSEDEAIFDMLFYADLAEDEAILVMDYKMKILSSKHREKQSAWFSKRGFSVLGALIICGSPKDNPVNKVFYHSFISEDTTQNTQAINCAKQ